MGNSFPGPLAVLDSRLLDGRNYESFLSQCELEEYSRFRTPLRKSEWLAARLAAKFLFLNEGSARLTPAELDRFPASLYRDIEVLRNDRVRFGMPQVGRGAEFRDVALSHTHGIACAFLAEEGTVAIDLERVESRSPVFCRGNFTEGERAWAALSPNPSWTFTLLWSVKECLLKTPAYHHLSIWDMPSLDLRIVAGEDELMRASAAGDFFNRMAWLGVEATHRNRTVAKSVAVSGAYDLVLSAIPGVDRRTV